MGWFLIQLSVGLRSSSLREEMGAQSLGHPAREQCPLPTLDGASVDHLAQHCSPESQRPTENAGSLTLLPDPTQKAPFQG